MYAVIREGAAQGATGGQPDAGRAAFAALRARQPGFRGSLTVDAGDGKRAIVTLWEDERASVASRRVLEPEAAKLSGGPSRVVYQGEVIADDLTTR